MGPFQVNSSWRSPFRLDLEALTLTLSIPSGWQVVERSHPSYQLIVSVRVAASTLSSVERKGTLDESESSHHQRRSITSEEGDERANEYGKATVAVSLSLGKSEIKRALERYECVLQDRWAPQ